MMIAVLLAVLALTDCLLCGVRMAAGRSGLIAKRDWYLRSVARAGAWGVLVVGAHAVVVAALAQSPEAWASFVAAGRVLVLVYGAFATAIFLAFAFYFAPIGDFRVLTNVLVFGPLTLARRAVVAGGMAAAVWCVPDWRVVVVAASATIAMTAFEPLLGRRYASEWRSLV